MRTLAIIVLATINLVLLVSVSVPLLRHEDDAPVAATAAVPTGPVQDKAAPISVKVVPIANLAKVVAAKPADSGYLYVNANNPQYVGIDRDGKTVADLKDAKDLEPIAQLLPATNRILGGTADPNSEFVSNPSQKHSSSSGSSGSSTRTLGFLAPPQVPNVVPPTVSEETPL